MSGQGNESETTAILKVIKEELRSTNEELRTMKASFNSRLDGMDRRLDGMDRRFDGMDRRFDGMDSRFDGIEDSLKRLEAGKVASDGDAMAKHVTVAISRIGWTARGDIIYNRTGTGLIIYLDESCFLLTAAHVVVGLDLNEQVSLQWGIGDKKAIRKAEVTGLYIDERYIKDGTHDIGLAKLNWVEAGKEKEAALEQVPVKLHPANEMGTTVVAHGVIYLSGQIVHVDENMRMMISSMSAPGCSGSPLFNSKKGLVAVVHGDGKHCHSKTEVAGFSHSVFADAASFAGYKFQQVTETKDTRDILKKAERLSQEEAEKSDVKFCIRRNGGDCPELLRKIAMSLYPESWENRWCSWNDVMKDLAPIALVPLSDNGPAIKGNVLNCRAPQTQDTKQAHGLQQVTPDSKHPGSR